MKGFESDPRCKSIREGIPITQQICETLKNQRVPRFPVSRPYKTFLSLGLNLRIMRAKICTILFVFILSFVSNAQQMVCADPDAWNYSTLEVDPGGNCLYVTDCGEGEQLFFLNFFMGPGYTGTEIHLISTDEQDTLVSAILQNPLVDSWINAFPICLDTNTCYYLDIYMLETTDHFIANIEMFQPDPPGFFYLLPPNGPSNYFRLHAASSFDQCPRLGCTDPVALNYDPYAIQNDNCIYCDEYAIVAKPNVQFPGSMYYQIEDEAGEVVDAFSFNDGPSTPPQKTTCLPDGCYDLVISGDAWRFNSLVFLTASGDTLAEMTLTQDGEARLPVEINSQGCPQPTEDFGCTNPSAGNFDANAIIDDGSCNLMNDACDISVEIDYDPETDEIKFVTDIFSVDYPIAVRWDFGDGSDPIDGFWSEHSYASSGVYQVCTTIYSFSFFGGNPLCYATYCFEFDTQAYGEGGVNTVSYAEGAPLSLETPAKPGLKIYPNPSSGTVQISLPESSEQFRVVSIHSLQGNLVLTMKESQGEVDISNLAAGIYILHVETSQNIYSGKLMKIE